jgi:TrmH family RNA methyltransferase
VLADAIAGGANVREVFALIGDAVAEELAQRAGAELVSVSDVVLARLAPTEHPRGPVAVVEIPTDAHPGGDTLWVEVSDPGNAGTLIRTAAAFGFTVAAPGGVVDLWSPKVLRAGAGGHFRTGVLQPASFDEIDGIRIVTVVEGGAPVRDLRSIPPGRPCLVVVGSEAHGVDAMALDQADITTTIPMPGGTESLNAAVAGAIVMHELAARRMSSGDEERAD